MFDMSWGEIMVIGGVALIVIGPKDLPKALRTVGQMTAKVRRLAGEFQSQFAEAMREAELEDVKKEVAEINRSVSSAASAAFNPLQTIRDEIKTSMDTKPAATAADEAVWGTNPDPLPTGASLVEAGDGGIPHAAEPAGPQAGRAGPVEEVGPVPHITGAREATGLDLGLAPAAAPANFPETQTLVPMPIEPPAPPAAAPPPGEAAAATRAEEPRAPGGSREPGQRS